MILASYLLTRSPPEVVNIFFAIIRSIAASTAAAVRSSLGLSRLILTVLPASFLKLMRKVLVIANVSSSSLFFTIFHSTVIRRFYLSFGD